MKPNVLLIAILMFFVTTQVNAADRTNEKNINFDLYGYLYTLDYFKGNTSSAPSFGARLGLKTESKIIDNIVSYARIQTEIKGIWHDSNVDNHYAFTGFKLDSFGSIDYGKNNGIIREISYYTDVLPEFGGDVQHYTILGDRTNSLLTYHNQDFFGLIDGLDFALQYADKNVKKFSADNSVTDEAYGFNWQYIIVDSSLKIGMGYAEVRSDRSYILGVNYNEDNVYLSSIYAQTIIHSQQYTGLEAVFAYGVDFEMGHLTSIVAYISHQKGTSNKVKYLDFGAQYDLNKHVSFILDYRFDLMTKLNDKLVLGLIYYL